MRLLRSAISLVLCFATLSAFAANPAHTIALKQAFDDFQFAVTVQGNANDKVVFEKESAEFNKSMEKLIKDGLNKDEVVAFARAQIKDTKKANELTARLEKMDLARMTESQFSSTLFNMRSDLYTTGAAWNGMDGTSITIGLVVAAVLGYALWFYSTHDCVSVDTCASVSCDTYYGDYYTSSSCGCNSACTQWVKK